MRGHEHLPILGEPSDQPADPIEIERIEAALGFLDGEKGRPPGIHRCRAESECPQRPFRKDAGGCFISVLANGQPQNPAFRVELHSGIRHGWQCRLQQTCDVLVALWMFGLEPIQERSKVLALAADVGNSCGAHSERIAIRGSRA